MSLSVLDKVRRADVKVRHAGAHRPIRVAAYPAFRIRDVQPYTNLLYDAVQQHGVEVSELTRRGLLTERYDVVHVHWPEFPLMPASPLEALRRSATLLLLLAWARRRGARLVWTAHDLAPHEVPHPGLGRWYWPSYRRLVDGVICLTDAGLAAVRQRFPALADRPACVAPLGHYRGEYADTVGRAEARARLDLGPDDRVLLFFGLIRPYKNVPGLLEAFGGIADPSARLLVAGRPDADDLRIGIDAAAASDPRVRPHLGLVPADDVQLLFRAADLVVAPYAEVFNSSTALLALSFGRPVLVPSKGALVELQRAVGDVWVQTFDGPVDGRTLERALDAAASIPDGATPPLDAYDWDAIGRTTAEFYAELVGAAARGDATSTTKPGS